MSKELVHKSAVSHLLPKSHHSNIRFHRLNSSKPQPAFFSPCRTLALVQTHHPLVSEAWFDGTNPHRFPPGTGVRPEAPPDERTLKLGKSMLTSIKSFISSYYLTDCFCSSSDPSNSPANAPSLPFTNRNSIPSHIASPLSIYTPTSSERLRSSRLPCRPLDCPCLLGQSPLFRRKVDHPQRAHDKKWNTSPSHHQWRQGQRETCRKMEDRGQDKRQGSGSTISRYRSARAGRQNHRMAGRRHER